MLSLNLIEEDSRIYSEKSHFESCHLCGSRVLYLKFFRVFGMKQEALGVALSILNLEHIRSTDTGCGLRPLALTILILASVKG